MKQTLLDKQNLCSDKLLSSSLVSLDKWVKKLMSMLSPESVKNISLPFSEFFESDGISISSSLSKNIHTFLKNSSPVQLIRFQPYFAQSILGWKGFKFVQMKGSTPFQGAIITKSRKCIDEFHLQNHWANFNQT